MFPYIIVVLRKSTNFRPHLVRPALSFFLSFEYWYRQEAALREVAPEVAAQVLLRVLLDGGVGQSGIEVVEHGVEPDTAAGHGFQAEEGVVHAAQLARGDEDERIASFGDVVDGEVLVLQGDHQAAGTFDQHRVVAAGQFLRSLPDAFEVYFAAVDACGQVGRGGVGEDFGHGEAFAVFGQVAGAHEAAVQVDILAVAHVACLDEFLGDDASAFFDELRRIPGGTVGLSGIGVDAADEVDVVHNVGVFWEEITYIG